MPTGSGTVKVLVTASRRNFRNFFVGEALFHGGVVHLGDNFQSAHEWLLFFPLTIAMLQVVIRKLHMN